MSDDLPAVGLVGEDDRYTAVHERLATAGVDVGVVDLEGTDGGETGGPDWPEEPLDLLVAVGEGAVADAVAASPRPPVLPIDAGAGIRAVPTDAVDDLVASIAGREWDVEGHVPLSVAVAGEPVGTATFDVTLVTAEAAHISEYAVRADGTRLDRARADGVVVATPAGSTDYARRVDAPVLAPDTGIAVAWIAPFRTDPDRWVVEPRVLEISVERDGASVDLHVDDRVVRSVDPTTTVSVTAGDPFDVAVVDESRDRYE